MKTKKTIRTLVTILALTAGLSALVGCGATKPASASFASVVIQNHSMEEIRYATGEVFTADGYRVMVHENQLKCEKEGSRATELAYEGLAGGGAVDVRVLASIVQLSETSHRLQCNAYIVRNPGDPVFEDVSKLMNIRSGPYQKLLDQVADKLK
jgi:hypothetical protein